MDSQDRIGFAHRPAAVDHFLSTAFHFRIAALHAVKVECFGVCARIHRACSAAAQTDAHARAAEDDEKAARRRRQLLRLIIADVADAAREHDGLVVAVTHAAHIGFKSTEVAEQIRTAEFVVECRAPQGTFSHDGKRRSNAAGRAVGLRVFDARGAVGIVFPLVRGFAQAERRSRKARETRFRTCAAAGRAFVSDFAARAGRRTGERRNGGRMVMRFNLKDRMRTLGLHFKGRAERIRIARARIEALNVTAFKDGRVVGIGRNGELRSCLVRSTDHAEKRFSLLFSVNRPFGVEDLVAAVFRIGLRKHHQFNVSRITLKFFEGVCQVGDFIVGKRQSHVRIGFFKRLTALSQKRHRFHRTPLQIYKEVLNRKIRRHRGFRHAVVKERGKCTLLIFRKHRARFHLHGKERAAFNAKHAGDAAVADDIRCLRSPGRNRAEAGNDQHVKRIFKNLGRRGTVVEKSLQTVNRCRIELLLSMHKMNEAARYRFNGAVDLLESAKQPLLTKIRKCARPFEVEDDAGNGRHDSVPI